MNQRLTIAAAIAVILACSSEFFLIHGSAWMITAIGAVTVVALAGLLTRLAPVPAACGATVLAALATVPMFTASSVALKVGGAAIVICCAASATRWRALRALAGLITYLSGLLLYLNAVRAHSQSIGLIVPTTASLHHLLVLAGNGMAQAKYAPPVTATAGVILLAAGSIGLAAIVIDFLAVRLHRPAIAGLPLLVIYLAPLATAAHVQGLWGATAFLAAAAGYLGLLASDGRTRLRSWGRVISVWHRPGASERLGGADVAALSATGRRIGVAAICAAVIAPLLLPSFNLHRLFASHPSGVGGVGEVGVLDPVVQLHGLLSHSRAQTILTYRSSSASQSQYLQVYVLNYDQELNKWLLVDPARKLAVKSGPLLSPPGVNSSMPPASTKLTVSMRTTTSGYSSQLEFLPVPYWPERLSLSGTWWEAYNTLMIFSGQTGQQAGTYTVTSGLADPTPGMLKTAPHPPTSMQPYLTYSGTSSPVTRALLRIARHVTAGQHTAFDKAVALEQWFHSNMFIYSVNSDIQNTPQGLLEFLTTAPQGFCQQFAFAMAVLARLLGIPSRVVIGYTGGSFHNGQWVVTTADAHAWPELYFQGAGWLRFEPTPGGSNGQGTAVEPSYVTQDSASQARSKGNGHHHGGPVTPLLPGSGPPHNLIAHFTLPGGAGKLPAVAHRVNRGNPLLAILIAAAVLLLAAGVPGTARLVARRRRWRTAISDLGLAQAAWREVRADLVDLGMPCLASDSPRTVARRVCSAIAGDEAAEQAVRRITTVVERAYYAQAPASAKAIRGDVVLVRRSLASSVRWQIRWRARLFPASVLGPARAATAHRLGSITGWVPATREEATA
jgi:transglutaminase-like putative cysteine protease